MKYYFERIDNYQKILVLDTAMSCNYMKALYFEISEHLVRLTDEQIPALKYLQVNELQQHVTQDHHLMQDITYLKISTHACQSWLNLS